MSSFNGFGATKTPWLVGINKHEQRDNYRMDGMTTVT
jgi:hypothetical protein